MRGEDEDQLAAILGPPTPPSKEPDPIAKSEREKYQKLTPTDRLEANYKEYLTDLRRQRDELRQEVGEARLALDNLKPRYAALVESRRGLAETTGIAAFLVGIGGLILAVAGIIPDEVWRLIGVSIGATMFLVGFVIQFRASTLAGGFKHDHMDEGITG